MKFKPKTEDEITGLLPDGEYDFEVIDAEDTTSKSGNDMIAVQLKVFDGKGGSRLVFDYLLEAVAYKLKHIADATGLQVEYAAGVMVAEDLHGKCGRVKIGTQKAGDYPERNIVRDYLPLIAAATPKPKLKPKPAMAAADIDDEIPF